jgi:hypothetical protein
MNKKILGGAAILVISAIAVFNMNLESKSNRLSGFSLANVEALAGENNGSSNKCEQVSVLVNYKEMCSTNPVKHVTTYGVNYSCKKSSSGSTTCKSGFEGTYSNDCTGESTTHTATASGC